MNIGFDNTIELSTKFFIACISISIVTLGIFTAILGVWEIGDLIFKIITKGFDKLKQILKL